MDGLCQLTTRPVADLTNQYTFMPQDFIESSVVRIDEGGQITSTNGLSRKQSGKLGYSLQLKFKSAPEEGSRFKVQQTILFSGSNLGKRPARSLNGKIGKFIDSVTKNSSEVSRKNLFRFFYYQNSMSDISLI